MKIHRCVGGERSDGGDLLSLGFRNMRRASPPRAAFLFCEQACCDRRFHDLASTHYSTSSLSALYCESCFAHHLAAFCDRRQVAQGGPGGCGSGFSRPPRVDCPYSTCAHNIDAPEGRPAEVFPARGGASAEHPEAVHAPRARRHVVSQVCVCLCVCMHV